MVASSSWGWLRVQALSLSSIYLVKKNQTNKKKENTPKHSLSSTGKWNPSLMQVYLLVPVHYCALFIAGAADIFIVSIAVNT